MAVIAAGGISPVGDGGVLIGRLGEDEKVRCTRFPLAFRSGNIRAERHTETSTLRSKRDCNHKMALLEVHA